MSSEKALYFCNILVSRLINSGKTARSIQPNKILCVKLDEIGDMVTALAVFARLKEEFPSAEITVLCRPFAGSLLLNNPNVSHIIYDLKDWNTAFDLVIELRGNWKTLWRCLNFKYWPRFRLDRGWVRLKQRGNQPHESITNYRIIEPIFNKKLANGGELQNQKLLNDSNKPLLFPSSEDEAAADLWMSQAKRQAYSIKGEEPKGLAILHTGARRMLRQWPLSNFAEVAKWLWETQRIWSIWVGTSEEKPNLETIWKPELGTLWISEEASPRNTSLLAFYAFIQRASLFIGNESGPLQLAALGEIPLLGLFGPGVERVFYPINARVFAFGDNAEATEYNAFTEFQGDIKGSHQSRELRSDLLYKSQNTKNKQAIIHCILPCNPCDQINCVHPDNPCMRRISLNLAIQVLNNYVFTQ